MSVTTMAMSRLLRQTPASSTPLRKFSIFSPEHILAQQALKGSLVFAKDNFAIKDNVQWVGNKLVNKNRPPAHATALSLQVLFQAGATLKQICPGEDQAFVTTGCDSIDENGQRTVLHNPHDPERVVGGSTSGVPVAMWEFARQHPELAKLILGVGSDTGMSIRQPAGLTGLFALRLSSGLTSVAGMETSAPRCDTVGLMTFCPDLLRTTIAVLDGRNPREQHHTLPERLIIPIDLLAFCSEEVRTHFEQTLQDIQHQFPTIKVVRQTFKDIAPSLPEPAVFMEQVGAYMMAEVGIVTGGLTKKHPQSSFSPRFWENMQASLCITPEEATKGYLMFQHAGRALSEIFKGDGDYVCIPTVAGPPPLIKDKDAVDGLMRREFPLNAWVNITRGSQLVIPYGYLDMGHQQTFPGSFSLIGPRESDFRLACTVAHMMKALQPTPQAILEKEPTPNVTLSHCA